MQKINTTEIFFAPAETAAIIEFLLSTGKKAKNFQYLLNLKNRFQKKKKDTLRFYYFIVVNSTYKYRDIFCFFADYLKINYLTKIFFASKIQLLQTT